MRVLVVRCRVSSDGFRVTVKASAIEANPDARALGAAGGGVIPFPSREAAVSAVERVSTPDARIRVQAAAPQDPMPVDAYVVADPVRRVRDPRGTPEEGLAFDVGAIQYGALGEALVCAYRTDPPLLSHYIRGDLDLAPTDPLRVDLERDPEPVEVRDPEAGSTVTWIPDCRAAATGGPDGDLEAAYLCEIKTGAASYERAQRRAMGLAAADRRVLAIRLDIRQLPQEYTATVEPVGPSFAEPPSAKPEP